MTNSELIDLFERIQLTHNILNELREKPLPVLQKLNKEIEEAIVYLQITSPEAAQCWADAMKQRKKRAAFKEEVTYAYAFTFSAANICFAG